MEYIAYVLLNPATKLKTIYVLKSDDVEVDAPLISSKGLIVLRKINLSDRVCKWNLIYGDIEESIAP